MNKFVLSDPVICSNIKRTCKHYCLQVSYQITRLPRPDSLL